MISTRRNFIEKIVDKQFPLTLVFEDDIYLEKNFIEVVNLAIDELALKDSSSVVSLGNAGNLYVNKEDIKENQYLYTARRHRAADSYLIDLEAAISRLSWLLKNKTDETAGHMYNTIDNEVGNKIYWLSPTVVEQGSQNGFMKSSVSKNKFFHRYRWLWRDFRKKHNF